MCVFFSFSVQCRLKRKKHFVFWCLLSSASYRMRERGLWICGVGVWSLLLSLCLTSLTHAHRSHTGKWISTSYLFVCVLIVHIPVSQQACFYRTYSIGSFADYLYGAPLRSISFTCCKAGVNRLHFHLRECQGQIPSETWDRRGHLPGWTLSKKLFNKWEGNTSRPAKRPAQLRMLLCFCSPIMAEVMLKNTWGLQQKEQWALFVCGFWLCDGLVSLHHWAWQLCSSFLV